MRTQKILRSSRVTLVALLVACGALLFAGAASTQTSKPISREGLVKSVRINGLTTRELVAQIQRRGVAFEMTPDAEEELRAAGARPQVIAHAPPTHPPAGAAAAPAAPRHN